MSEKTESSVLRRKAQIGQEQFQARAMTAARALRVTLAKVAEDELGLPLAAIGLTEARGPAEPVLKALDDTTLLILLDSPGRGPGAALIDAALAGAIVQQQTMGRVSELREGAPLRKPTRTDASLTAPLLDALFDRAGPLPDTTSQMELLSGLRFGADIATTRLLGMSLDAGEYVHFSITVDVANGTRQGKIDLLLPLPVVRAETPSSEAEVAEPAPTTLEPVVMSLNAQLRVALCRMRMPFSQLAELVPGDTLPLSDGVMTNAEVLTIAGRMVARGKLGQIDGVRAVRLLDKEQAGARPASDHGTTTQDPRPAGDNTKAGAADADVHDADGKAGLPDLAGPQSDAAELPELPELTGEDTDAMFDLAGLPDIPDLPGGLEDSLPELPELPELPMAHQA